MVFQGAARPIGAVLARIGGVWRIGGRGTERREMQEKREQGLRTPQETRRTHPLGNLERVGHILVLANLERRDSHGLVARDALELGADIRKCHLDLVVRDPEDPAVSTPARLLDSRKVALGLVDVHAVRVLRVLVRAVRDDRVERVLRLGHCGCGSWGSAAVGKAETGGHARSPFMHVQSGGGLNVARKWRLAQVVRTPLKHRNNQDGAATSTCTMALVISPPRGVRLRGTELADFWSATPSWRGMCIPGLLGPKARAHVT